MLVSIFLWAIFVLLIILTILIFSTIKVSINKLNISNLDNANRILEKITVDYNFTVSLCFLNIIPYFKIKINKQKLKEYNLKKNFSNLNLFRLKKELPILKEYLNKLELHFERFNMKLFIGTTDILLTNIIVLIISTLLPIGLARVIKNFDIKKYEYSIRPLYANKNLFKLTLNCIINTKLVHIIHVIYIFLKKKRREVNYGKPSNRGAYDNSYE